MSRRRKEVDTLSSLPEDVLSVILSLMPTKFAVRTGILSKRWRYTWTLTHNLDFADTRLNSYSHVDRVLMLCKTTRLKIFRLHFSEIYVPNAMTVSKWISEAVRLNVSELDIHMISNNGLPFSLFTCNTLSKLSLKLNGHYNKFSWECPPSICLPNLKTLDIIDYFKRGDINMKSISCDKIFKLIHGCPLLEDLSLKIHNIQGNIGDLYFKAPTLKRLRLALLYYSSGNIHKVVLNVPNLEYLDIEESFVMCPLFVMEDLSSLVKAKVSCYVFHGHLWVELLKGLTKVRNLTLDSNITRTKGDALKLHLPEFSHVKKLAIVGCDPIQLWKIPQILERFYQLEHLCIKKERDESRLSIEEYIPTLTLMNIVTVKYTDTTKSGKFATQFLKFILEYAVDLKKLIVRYNSVLVSNNKIQELDAELSKHPRASRNCQIHLAPYS